MLADVRAGDCTTKPGSAAEKIGFKGFDVRSAGLSGYLKGKPIPTVAPAYPTAIQRQ
jgi:hypothetical protein